MKLYDYRQVDAYILDHDLAGQLDIIPGALTDTYIIYHSCGTIEVFEETYINEWSSGLVRHIYKSGKLPARFKKALREYSEGQ